MKSIVQTKINLITALVLAIICANVASAQNLTDPILTDNNGNGSVSLVALGDSITSGLGDALSPGQDVPALQGTEYGEGYPGRLTRYLGVPVENEGIPGEELVSAGIDRVPTELSSSLADAMIFFEGVNDSLSKVSSGQIGRVLQRAINVARISGRGVVLVTLPTPCCNHAGREIFISAYNNEIRSVAAVNTVTLADVARAWETTCTDAEECELYNLPEGLHPNKLGYDVIAQTMAASILDIDIFAADGAAKLAGAIGVPIESIKVKPAVGVTTP